MLNRTKKSDDSISTAHDIMAIQGSRYRGSTLAQWRDELGKKPSVVIKLRNPLPLNSQEYSFRLDTYQEVQAIQNSIAVQVSLERKPSTIQTIQNYVSSSTLLQGKLQGVKQMLLKRKIIKNHPISTQLQPVQSYCDLPSLNKSILASKEIAECYGLNQPVRFRRGSLSQSQSKVEIACTQTQHIRKSIHVKSLINLLQRKNTNSQTSLLPIEQSDSSGSRHSLSRIQSIGSNVKRVIRLPSPDKPVDYTTILNHHRIKQEKIRRSIDAKIGKEENRIDLSYKFHQRMRKQRFSGTLKLQKQGDTCFQKEKQAKLSMQKQSDLKYALNLAEGKQMLQITLI